MAKTLSDGIKDWEVRNGVMIDTIKRARAGKRVKPGTAYQIAKAMGSDDSEAKEFADQASKPHRGRTVAEKKSA